MYRPADPACPICKQPLTAVIVTAADAPSQIATWRCFIPGCPENVIFVNAVPVVDPIERSVTCRVYYKEG